METGQLSGKVSRGALILGGSALLSRILGLARENLLAQAGGTGSETDAYYLAFLLPDLINHFLASGFLSTTLIPLLVPLLKDNRKKEAEKLFSGILVFMTGLAFLVSIVCWVFAENVVPMLSSGTLPPDTLSLAVEYTRIILFAQVFFTGGSLFMAWQYTSFHYGAPALAPLVYNGSIIAGGIWAIYSGDMRGFLWGVLAGALMGNFALQLWGAWRCGLRLSGPVRPFSKDTGHYLLMSLPFVVGTGMTFSSEFIFRFFGPTDPGGISSLGFALRITLVAIIFAQSLGVASYPLMTRMSSEKKWDELNNLLSAALARTALIILPLVMLLSAFAQPLVHLYLGYGKFGSDSTEQVSAALVLYSFAVLPMGLQIILVRAFYSARIFWRPALYTASCFFFAFLMAPLVPVEYARAKAPLLSAGVAWLQLAVLVMAWRRLHPEGRFWKAPAKSIARGIFPAGFLYLTCKSSLSLLPENTARLWETLSMVTASLVAVTLYATFLHMLKDPQWLELEKKLFSRFSKLLPRRFSGSKAS